MYDTHERTAETQRRWFEEKRSAGLPVLVAKAGDEVAGFCSYGSFRPWPGYAATVESSVYVANRFWGRRIGTALMTALIESARAQKLHALMAGIDANNLASLRLHETLGFVRVGQLRQVGRKFDRWLDLVLMELILDGAELL